MIRIVICVSIFFRVQSTASAEAYPRPISSQCCSLFFFSSFYLHHEVLFHPRTPKNTLLRGGELERLGEPCPVADESRRRQAVLTGLAPDGGLYIPETIPQLPENWQTDWKDYSFVQLSVAVLSLYISPDEISESELRSLVEKSYSTFRHPDVTPLTKLDDKRYVLELFHGPTFAFKDVALQLLGNLFEFFLLRRNARKAPGEAKEKLTVVGATSGDTGRQVFPSFCANVCR